MPDSPPILPSISHLLRLSPLPSHEPNSIPIVSFSPASPISSRSDSVLPQPRRHTSSPLLSPSESVSSRHSSCAFQPSSPFSAALSPQSDSYLDEHTLPPLQGYDPPRPLRLPSPSLLSLSPLSSVSSWPSPSGRDMPSTPLAPPSPISSCSFLSDTASNCVSAQSSRPSSPQSSSPRSRSCSGDSTQTSASAPTQSKSSQPVMKRRRGRPPNVREAAVDGNWTFLTPTVWNVATSRNSSTSEASLSDLSSLSAVETGSSSGSLTAFTNSNLDTVLQMPRKKRGRKPKTHIVGNSCFVWKDLACTRTKKKIAKR